MRGKLRDMESGESLCANVFLSAQDEEGDVISVRLYPHSKYGLRVWNHTKQGEPVADPAAAPLTKE